MLTLLSLTLWFCLQAVETQTGGTIDPAKLPQMAATAQEYVPRGWLIEAQTEGDLNRDSIPDLAVTLVERMPANADKDNPPERERALLILFKTVDGKYSRAALATKVLACTRCGGAFYGVAESPTEVEISTGVIIIKQDYGSREMTNETFRFRYDPEIRRFVMIGLDVEKYDRITGDGVKESTNFSTGVKLITKSKLNPQTDKNTIVSNAQRRVSRDKKFIEDVTRSYDK